MQLHPTNLWQRILLFILLPTFLLLMGVAAVCYVFVRNLLLEQWGETAIAELQSTAHHIDMRLRQPKDLLNLVKSDEESTGVDQEFLTHILRNIEGLEGVAAVNLNKPDSTGQSTLFRHAHPSSPNTPHFHLPGQMTISSPRYNHQQESRSVSLTAEFRGNGDIPRNRVEVVLSFDALIAQILQAPWWKNNKAFLIDDSGRVLAGTSVQPDSSKAQTDQAFGKSNPLERDTLAAMAQKSHGTVFGAGIPPREVSGFYRLAEAPWTMVIIAPGQEILRPIIRFKVVYGIAFAVTIPLILLLILGVTNGITARIKALSAAADSLARGRFGPPLAITAADEVGELTRSFNEMTSQLQQRLKLQEAMDIAGEVQQNLLPLGVVARDRLTAGGICLYCDETGGDYFDIIRFDEDERRLGVAVGDVVGHGVGAALLMTTVRALLRCRVHQPGDLGRIMADVNRLLFEDTVKSGNFVTLFYLEADCGKDTVSWVRCGHEPAIVYSPATGRFSELGGPGVALGVLVEGVCECNEMVFPEGPHCILIYSDGAWEVENEAGEHFGRERLKGCLAACHHLDPQEMLTSINEEITAFRGKAPQQDDITLAIVKIL